uniref:Uncharacterized protein n=1 Tax=Anguilla anguilla TaxID=7936 RepID=A0A0E9WH35_ANGAN
MCSVFRRWALLYSQDNGNCVNSFNPHPLSCPPLNLMLFCSVLILLLNTEHSGIVINVIELVPSLGCV